MARYSQLHDDQSARISRLEHDLYMARETIVSLAPEEYRDLLRSYFRCETRSETYHWVDSIVAEVIEKLEPTEDQIWGHRAYCPLCRGGATNFYGSEGFAYPEGLRRHLVGFGRVRECPVIEAARRMAQESWNSQFGPKERVEKAAKARSQEERLKTETTYIIKPSGDPVLIDDDYFRSPRKLGPGDFSIKWAEERLVALGFAIQVNGLSRSYTLAAIHEGRDLVVFADPRRKGEITMRVFDPKRGPKKGREIHQFRIRDQWKNNLAQKLSAGIEAAGRSNAS